MKIDTCRICKNTNLEKFLDLGDQPWCNDFVTEENLGKELRYPLQVCFCHDCTAIQINYTVPKEAMYSDHLYLSGITKSVSSHFQQISNKVCKHLVSKGLVVDIGSNDGTLLKFYKNNNMPVLGVDPCEKAARIAINNGIKTSVAFFNFKHANDILLEYGPAKVISAANVFYHVEELHDITKGVKHLLEKHGVFVMHGSYLPTIINRKEFDIMYHEHLLYYRIGTLNRLLNQYDLEVFDIDEAPNIHGGSIVVYACHSGNRPTNQQVIDLQNEESRLGFDKIDIYREFSKSIADLKIKVIELIHNIKKTNKSIYAFGAPAKGTVMLNYCGLTNEEIELAVEKNTTKVGRYIPCTNIPIMDESTILEPDYYLLLAWNFVDEFCKSDAYLNGDRKFIVPVPEPKILFAKS